MFPQPPSHDRRWPWSLVSAAPEQRTTGIALARRLVVVLYRSLCAWQMAPIAIKRYCNTLRLQRRPGKTIASLRTSLPSRRLTDSPCHASAAATHVILLWSRPAQAMMCPLLPEYRERVYAVERAVFLLREVFEYEYSKIFGVLGQTEANCRQILRRARQHVSAMPFQFAGFRYVLHVLNSERGLLRSRRRRYE